MGAALSLQSEPGRILDFDIENRPLSYWIPDRPTAEVTAIAWSWVGEDEVHVRTLLPPPHHEASMADMLLDFKDFYDRADMVTGHYIRRHDLPIINGALFDNGFELLGPKLTQDTKLDLIRFKDISASQENLAELYDLEHEKKHMSQVAWRQANQLTDEGIALTIERVTDDVRQHKALRAALIEDNALKAPTVWRP